MEKVYVGLDVGSTQCHVVALNENQEVLADRQFQTGRGTLIEAIERLPGSVRVHLEASNLAGWVRQLLVGRGHDVVVSHPKSNAWIAKDPLKCDSVDARKLAELARMGRVHEVYYAEDAQRAEFKQLVQHYDDLTDEQSRLKVKIKSRLKAQGILARSLAVYGKVGRVKVLQQVPGGASREALRQLYGLMDAAVRQQQLARKLLLKEARRYPEVERFQGVPGVGPISACRFSAYVQTPHRFANKRKLWRYCRLAITDRSSDGKPLGRRRLDRNGNGRLKETSRTVFLAAVGKTRESNMFRRAYESARARGIDPTHARLTVQRKILTVLWTLWKEGSRYQDDKG